jgi:hypothetical protein
MHGLKYGMVQSGLDLMQLLLKKMMVEKVIKIKMQTKNQTHPKLIVIYEMMKMFLQDNDEIDEKIKRKKSKKILIHLIVILQRIIIVDEKSHDHQIDEMKIHDKAHLEINNLVILEINKVINHEISSDEIRHHDQIIQERVNLLHDEMNKHDQTIIYKNRLNLLGRC